MLIHLKEKSKQAVLAAIDKLRNNPCIVSVEPDYIIDTHFLPNDRYFNYLWGVSSVNLPLAWNIVTGSKNVSVGVIDSGIDYNHPDLTNNLSMAVDAQSLDSRTPINSRIFGANPMDETGHGTHVAGTVGAVGNNFVGVCGACWNINLISLKIGNIAFDLAAVIKSIDFATKNNIDILNASFGGRFYSQSLKFAIEQYEGLFVVSAGNDGTDNDIFPVFPASYESRNILSVAASDYSNNLATFSNYGKTSVDIAAPGVDIFSTDISSTYSFLSGTSMAAPLVAGVAALLKSFRPNLTALELKNIILSSVDKQVLLYGRVLSGGTLNASKMIASVIR